MAVAVNQTYESIIHNVWQYCDMMSVAGSSKMVMEGPGSSLNERFVVVEALDATQGRLGMCNRMTSYSPAGCCSWSIEL
jgi:hypothetical protein